MAMRYEIHIREDRGGVRAPSPRALLGDIMKSGHIPSEVSDKVTGDIYPVETPWTVEMS